MGIRFNSGNGGCVQVPLSQEAGLENAAPQNFLEDTRQNFLVCSARYEELKAQMELIELGAIEGDAEALQAEMEQRFEYLRDIASYCPSLQLVLPAQYGVGPDHHSS